MMNHVVNACPISIVH